MKILLVSLLKRPVTPDEKASRPRVICEIAQGLIKRGHTVSLLGTADSHIPGVTVIPAVEHASIKIHYENEFYAETARLTVLAKTLEKVGNDFDIIHNHTYPEFVNLFVADRLKTPMITTVHAQATTELDSALAQFPNAELVSISEAHRAQFVQANINHVIYNGVDTSIYTYVPEKKDYLLWAGRLSKAKNPDGTFMDPKGIRWAIAVAQKTGKKLLLTGNIEDMEFYERDVKPHLNDRIQWIGPLSSELTLTKQEIAHLMQGAQAFLMTINWLEPFGLVMAESMSCGTPVIAFKRGSVPEIVIDGKTGFVVEPEDGVKGLVEAVNKLGHIKPEDCRRHVEEHFSTERMVTDYEALYQTQINQS